MTDAEKITLLLAALKAAQDELSVVVDCDPDMISDDVLEQIQTAIEAANT